MLQNVMRTKDSITLTILRLVLGVVFFAHGAQKALGWFGGYGFAGTMGYFTGPPLNLPYVLGALVIAAEFLGGIALILGLLTRVAAVGIAVDMIAAIFLVHLPSGLFANWGQMATISADGKTAMAIGEGYEFHLLAIAMALVLLIEGAGSFSADGAMAGNS